MEGKYKRTNQEIDQIINELVELITNGYSRQQIIQYCSDTHEVGERQTDNYLSRAYDVISTESQKLRTKLVKQSFKRYNELYYKNSAIQDYRECRAVQESITKLFGLNAPMHIDHSNQDGTLRPTITVLSEKGKNELDKI